VTAQKKTACTVAACRYGLSKAVPIQRDVLRNVLVKDAVNW